MAGTFGMQTARLDEDLRRPQHGARRGGRYGRSAPPPILAATLQAAWGLDAREAKGPSGAGGRFPAWRELTELRRRLADAGAGENAVSQARSAICHLEQRSESYRELARARHALAMIAFLGVAAPRSLLWRGLTVRTIGGENLSLLRLLLYEPDDTNHEHVSLVRKQAALAVLHTMDSSSARGMLIPCLLHPNPALQLTALYALEQLGDSRAVGAILPLANDPSSPVQSDARRLVRIFAGTPHEALDLLRPVPVPNPEQLLRACKSWRSDACQNLMRADRAPARVDPYG